MKQTVEKATQDVAKTERELAEIDATYDVLAAETQAALTRITADTLAGVTAEREGARLREQATWKRDEVQARRETLRLALPELKIRLEAAEEAARAARAEKLRGEAGKQVENLHRAVQQFGIRTRETVSAAREVERHRALVDATVAALTPLLADTEDVGVAMDEVEWPETASELSEFLAAGPRQPEAERERQAAEAATTAATQDAEQVAWLRRNPSEINLQLLPAHLRERGREVLDAHWIEHEAAQERLRAAAASREPLRI